jgi:Tfp pilus assembly protein PilF
MSIVNILLGPLWLVFLIVIHESSHAMAGKILGFKIFWVGIGHGRPLLDTRLLRFRLKLNLIPFHGETVLASPTLDGLRLRWWLVNFCGPASHLAILLLMMFLGGWASIRNSLGSLLTQPSAFGIFFSLNGLLLIGGLLPLRRPLFSPQPRPPSDGYRLVTIPFLSPSSMEDLVATYNVLEAADLIDLGQAERALSHCREALSVNPGSEVARDVMAIAKMRLGKWREARDILVELLNWQGSARDEVRNNIAWSDLFLGDPALLEEADGYSKEALGAQQRNVYFQGTRGAVLVSLGKFDEGVRLLGRAYSHHRGRHARASVAYWLAMAEARRGSQVKAIEWVGAAKAVWPNHEMAEMAVAEVETSGIAAQPIQQG